jgi:hypothetical protein
LSGLTFFVVAGFVAAVFFLALLFFLVAVRGE